MNVNQKNEVTWLTYPAFEKFPGIVHGFSTRLGGVSQGIYESMNLSFTRGDDEAAVRENYRRLSAAMGFSMEDIVTSDQTHTTNVRVVTEEDRGNGITKPRPYTDVDGIVTFRGNSFRDTPSHGYADMTDFRLNKLWSADTGSLSSGSAVWTGSGWTGQPLMMK